MDKESNQTTSVTEKQPTEVIAEVEHARKINKKLLTIILLLVLILFSGGAYLLSQNNKVAEVAIAPTMIPSPTSDPTANPTPTPSSIILTPNVDTSDWRTYKNTAINFEFKIPNKYTTGKVCGNTYAPDECKTTGLEGPESNSGYIGISDGKVNTTSYTYYLKFFEFSGTADELINNSNVNNGYHWSDYTKYTTFTKTNYLVNGQPLLKLKLIYKIANPKYERIGYFWTKGRYGFLLSSDSFRDISYSQRNSEIENEMDNIISTFKFTASSATPTPTCTPRPACLDATPRCLIPETSDMCPATVTPSS